MIKLIMSAVHGTSQTAAEKKLQEMLISLSYTKLVKHFTLIVNVVNYTNH